MGYGKQAVPESKVYGGVRYRNDTGHDTKASAQKRAKARRKEGYSARVSKFGSSYGVFIRGKR